MTREEADRLIEAINAQVDEPKQEWIPKKGELCEVWEVWNSSEVATQYPKVDRFHHFEKGVFFGMDSYGNSDWSWKHYRKLQTKATRHEWHGGVRPVDGLVVLEYRDGEKAIGQSTVCDWVHLGQETDIIAYWELES